MNEKERKDKLKRKINRWISITFIDFKDAHEWSFETDNDIAAISREIKQHGSIQSIPAEVLPEDIGAYFNY